MQELKWGRSKGGFVRSKCGRFDVMPRYNEDKDKIQSYDAYKWTEDDSMVRIATRCRTQSEAKEFCAHSCEDPSDEE